MSPELRIAHDLESINVILNNSTMDPESKKSLVKMAIVAFHHLPSVVKYFEELEDLDEIKESIDLDLFNALALEFGWKKIRKIRPRTRNYLKYLDRTTNKQREKI